MSDSPQVTILLPTYNRAAFLVDAIESALSQTYPSVSVLIADDASTDETSAVVAPYIERGAVRYLRHSRNLGICGNWRESIAQVHTPFFCILHDDDTFEPEFVETLIRPLTENPDIAFSFCDHWLTDARGQRLREETRKLSRISGRTALVEGHVDAVVDVAALRKSVPIGATIFRRDVFTPGLIQDQADRVIDLYVLYRCARLGHPAYYVPQRLMNYRCHSSNLSKGRTSDSLDGLLFSLGEMADDAVLTPTQRATFAARRAGILTIKGRRLLKESRPSEARCCFRESLQMRPSLKALGGYVMSLMSDTA